MTDLLLFITQFWYISIPAVFVVCRLAKYLHLRYVIKQLGAKPFTNVRKDGRFGFKSGKDAIKAKNEGRGIDDAQERFYLVDNPQVPTYRELIFGTPLVFTKDPENIKAMLATQFSDFSLGHRYTYFKPLLGKGIFTLDHEGWRDSRAMLRPQFAREQVAHVNSLEPHIQFLFKHIDKNNGEYFDIQELFFRFTVDSATEFLFGSSVSSLQDESIGCDTSSLDFAGRKQFAKSFNISQNYLATRSLMQNLYWLINPKEFQQCNQIVHEFSDYYVKKVLSYSPEELEKKSNGYVFLYELAKQTRDPIVLRDQALNILLAGRDTTAGLLSFAIFELARNPDSWQKLREEVLDKFGPSELQDITFENLKKCEYLKAVLNETLRMYPSVPRNARVATKNTTLPHGGGPDGASPIFIPKSSTVVYNISACQMDPRYYGKDVKLFRPERWWEESTRKLGWAYLPFNGGPRICLGQQFALTEASYVITRLAQTYSKLELKPGFKYPPLKLSHLTACLYEGDWVKMEK
ncbi:hypothetical protein KGF56_001170 [Candida oxycetoniae]|uniref:Uncharacterized protein n=1 Tax=Candida oxycetoniae TaxID=497107 RepID=A0AAI9WZ19_9ASCO|nr:uncharacterized protein KGF56_001170 [Candida oxycetoniae]KAI3405951.1 hypothetical protein KGF56_001170 [Candida oxycetoniae]